MVTTREELLNLPYSSDFDKEQEVFSTMLAAGFTDDFSSQRSPLSSEQIYPFFHQQIPAFEALGEVTLSDSLLDLYQVERPKLMLKPMAVYWRSVLTLKVWIQPKWTRSSKL